MSRRWIVIGSVLMVLVAAVAVGALHHFYGGGTDQYSAGLDMVRTAGTLVVGVGGLFALLLAARRQRSTEQTLVHQYLTLEHQREVAATAARDAVEQRITELYTRAVDQLGAEKAPVRLGGLHALERLAQNKPDQRQTIVDVICAYLRMPFIPPDDQAPSEDVPVDAHSRYEQRRQELQVRLTAQCILSAHLKPEAAAVFWDDIDLNLTGAYLHQLNLTSCHIRRAQFDGVTFAENTGFLTATFGGDAVFDGAEFTECTQFSGAEFAGDAFFEGAMFRGGVQFAGAKFTGTAGFREVKFTGYTDFSDAEFSLESDFAGAKFAGYTEFGDTKFIHALFKKAEFAGRTVFYGAEFAGDALFDGAEFTENTEFDRARVAPISTSGTRVVFPKGWTIRPAQAAEGEDEGCLYVVPDQDSSEQPTEATNAEEGQIVVRPEPEKHEEPTQEPDR